MADDEVSEGSADWGRSNKYYEGWTYHKPLNGKVSNKYYDVAM